MSDTGWVKIYKKIWANPVVTQDPETFTVWLWLLTHAAFKTKRALFAGEEIELQPGQLITGRKQISAETHVDETKVRRILKRLKSAQQIAQQTTSRGSLISILRWIDYQQSDQPNAQQVPNKCPTSAHQVPTNKEYKNIKNDEKLRPISECARDPEAQKNLEALRARIKTQWRSK